MANAHSIMELINPFPRQEEFLEATANFDYVLYGGAAGGGKSRILRWATVYWLIRWFKDYGQKGIVTGLFCETFRDLEDRQINEARKEFPLWLGHWSGYDFILNDALGGGLICFRNLDDPVKYRSVQFACLAAGSLVRMGDGSHQAIESIRVGQEVMTLQGPKKVTHIHESREEECAQLDIYDCHGQFAGTQINPLSHRILTVSGWTSYAMLSGAVSKLLSPAYDISQIAWQTPGSQSPGRPQPAASWQGRLVSHLDGGFFASLADNQSDFSGSYDEPQVTWPPQALFCRPVLHVPAPQSMETSTSSHPRPYAATYDSTPYGVPGCQDGCCASGDPCGEQSHPASDTSPACPPSPADAARHTPASSYKDGPRTPPLRSHRPSFGYGHPYTTEPGLASEAVQIGSCFMSPCGKRIVYDITVEGTNHYVSSSNVVNVNSISVDELTLSDPETFEYLVFSRLRWPGIPRTKFMGATNPGGIGHMYVKRLWIDRDFPDRMRHLEPQFKYVRALPTDNPYNTASYFEKLKALAPNLRRALLEGDWNTFTGQVFGEFRHEVHVVEPFQIPPWWSCWRSNDPGYNDPGVWHWFAVDGDGRVFCYREATFSEEDCREKIPYSEQARLVREMESVQEAENITWTVTGMDAWHRDSAHGTGKSIIDYYEYAGLHGFRQPIHGPGSVMRRVGITHEYLKPYKDPEGKLIAKLAIFNTCKKIIATFPLIPHARAPQNVEEVDKACNYLHHFDSLSYGLAAWHMSGSQASQPSKVVKGSLGDILGHEQILNPPRDTPKAFTYAKK